MTEAKIQQLLETLVAAVHSEPSERASGRNSEPQSPLKRGKLEEASEYEKAEATAQSVVLKIPVLNLAYDVLGDKMPPSVTELNVVLNLMGLLAALLLTVSIALPGAVSYEELEAVRARFNNPNSSYSGIHKMSNDAGIDSLAYYTLTSTNLLGSSLIVTLFMLITLSATGGRCKEFYKPYLKWWSYARWVFAWAFTTLVYGAYCCFQAFNWIFSIKFPDRYVEEHPGSDYRHDQGTYSSFGFCAIMSAVFPGIMSIVAIFLLGVANSAMFIKAQVIDKKVAPSSSTTSVP